MITVLLVGVVLLTPCSFRAGGDLPDARCTPGAVVLLPLAELCTGSYTGTRHVSAAQKREAFRRYGLDIRKVKGDWEVDHLVPRCLGGADLIENLWPEAAPGFHEKDMIGARVCREMCAGRRGDLEKSRDAFAHDWRDLR